MAVFGVVVALNQFLAARIAGLGHLRGVIDDVVTGLAVRADAPAGYAAQYLLGVDVQVHGDVDAFGGEHFVQRLGLPDVAREAVEDEPSGPSLNPIPLPSPGAHAGPRRPPGPDQVAPSMYTWAVRPRSVPSRTAARKASPVEMWGTW